VPQQAAPPSAPFTEYVCVYIRIYIPYYSYNKQSLVTFHWPTLQMESHLMCCHMRNKFLIFVIKVVIKVLGHNLTVCPTIEDIFFRDISQKSICGIEIICFAKHELQDSSSVCFKRDICSCTILSVCAFGSAIRRLCSTRCIGSWELRCLYLFFLSVPSEQIYISKWRGKIRGCCLDSVLGQHYHHMLQLELREKRVRREFE